MGNYFHLELLTKIFKPNSDPNYKPTVSWDSEQAIQIEVPSTSGSA